jgi:hypothetical protein
LKQANKSQLPLPALPAFSGKTGKLAFFILAIAPLLFGLLALYLGQDANWDLRNYHWYNAYAALEGRYGIDLLPSQTPAFYNPALDIPLYLLGTTVPAKVAGFILGMVQGLNFILIFMLCHSTLIINNPRHKVWSCAFLALLGMLGGGGIALLGTCFYDNITSLGLFASALLVLHHYKTMLSSRSLPKVLGLAALCGFPAGLMMGLKLPFVVFCVALCCAFLFVTGPLMRRLWMSFGFGLGVLLGLALSFGPWAVHLFTQYGNPVFPYLNQLFQSPLLPPTSFRDVQFIPTSWSDRLLFPFIFSTVPWRVGEIPWQDFRIATLYVLLPLCVVVRLVYGRNKNAPDRLTTYISARYLLWMAVLSYTVWLFLFSIYRYAIPMEMVSPLLIVVAMGMLPLRPKTRALLTGILLALIAVTIEPGDWGRKKPWLDEAVKADIPDLRESENLMILMAGFDPYSHVVTLFPKHIPFVRIQSNFASPNEDKGINKIIKERVSAHKGTFKLLITESGVHHSEAALNHFNLTFLPQKCQPVEDYLFKSELKLCDVKRLKQPESP